MGKKILITGGAGFIGSHLADRLLGDGHEVRALDNLAPQVHGDASSRSDEGARPPYLSKDVELIVGDVRDPRACRRALLGVDAVFHFAARVGVGQSMYEIADYTDVNNLGTATLLEAMTKRSIERLVVASSMSVYGEGLYVRPDGAPLPARQRSLDDLRRGDWELRDEQGQPARPIPTPEWKSADIASVYALSKFDQERLCLTVGRAYGIDSVALRFFNVYGPRQALSNPYTGVLAIFSARLLGGKAPLVNEDGQQRRDFVSVHDVVDACVRALEKPGVAGEVFNVGSGASYSIREVAERVARAVRRPELAPEITGSFRVGDIRHCFADIEKARARLGYEPRITLEEGLRELASWLSEGHAIDDRVEKAREELAMRGLAS